MTFISIWSRGTWPGPSIITCTSFAQARSVSSPSVLQLGELGLVAGVDQGAGAQAVAQAQGHVVAAGDVAQVIEALVEGVLAPVVHHPLGQQAAAATDDAGDPSLRQRQVLAEEAAVHGHEVHALLGLMLDHLQQVLDRHVLHAVELSRHLIDRNGAHGQRAGLDDRLADGVDVTAGTEVHDGVRAEALTDTCSLQSSVSMSEETAELPMLALILMLAAVPMPMGSRSAWLTLAGMTMRPAATS